MPSNNLSRQSSDLFCTHSYLIDGGIFWDIPLGLLGFSVKQGSIGSGTDGVTGHLGTSEWPLRK